MLKINFYIRETTRKPPIARLENSWRPSLKKRDWGDLGDMSVSSSLPWGIMNLVVFSFRQFNADWAFKEFL
jgi:hypothetical protein